MCGCVSRCLFLCLALSFLSLSLSLFSLSRSLLLPTAADIFREREKRESETEREKRESERERKDHCLLRLPISNMTILPAKQVACDLCGLHGSAMQRLPVENWSALVLLKTCWCGGDLTCIYIYLSVSICVYICIITYEMTYAFQLLAVLLTIYTYGYTHNCFCVDTSTHLYTYISTIHMPMYTYLHIFTHHIPQSR